MPRPNLFTKDNIIDASLEIMRREGPDGITARAVAEKLHTSTKPIFSLFSSMDEVKSETLERAYSIYLKAIEDAMKKGKYPPYKASGMAYIAFAGKEKELFKVLFMRDRTGETTETKDEDIAPLINLIMKNVGLTEEEARFFHLEMWITVHGIASMIATSYLPLDEETVSMILSDSYLGLRLRYEEKKHESN